MNCLMPAKISVSLKGLFPGLGARPGDIQWLECTVTTWQRESSVRQVVTIIRVYSVYSVYSDHLCTLTFTSQTPVSHQILPLTHTYWPISEQTLPESNTGWYCDDTSSSETQTFSNHWPRSTWAPETVLLLTGSDHNQAPVTAGAEFPRFEKYRNFDQVQWLMIRVRLWMSDSLQYLLQFKREIIVDGKSLCLRKLWSLTSCCWTTLLWELEK